MFEEYENKKRKQLSLMKSLMDYGMGFVILLLALFFFFRSRFDIPFNEKFPPNNGDKLIGAVFLIYAGWRIYRGYKKKYFR